MINETDCPFCASENTRFVKSVKDYFLTKETFSLYQCEQCGIVFTEPFPDAKNLGRYYETENYLSHQVNNTSLTAKIYNAVKKRNLKNKLSIADANTNKGKLLDIGCGIGDFLLIAKNSGWEVTGVEPSLHANDISEKRLESRIYKSIDELKDEKLFFDLITMWHVLEHVPDLNAQTDFLYQVLKPGGKLVVAVPNLRSWDAKHYMAYWAGYDVPRHLYHFDQDSIRKVFPKDKWLQHQTYPMKWDAFYVSLLSEKYMKKNLALPKAFINGLISNYYARKSGQYSSLIYTFTKK